MLFVQVFPRIAKKVFGEKYTPFKINWQSVNYIATTPL